MEVGCSPTNFRNFRKPGTFLQLEPKKLPLPSPGDQAHAPAIAGNTKGEIIC
jgi:hypothetical protein